MKKPKFQHDCENCDFLGNYFGLDVWICHGLGYTFGKGSIIARHGDDAPDYGSMPLSILLDSLADDTRTISDGGERYNYRNWLFSDRGAKFLQAMVLALAIKQLED